MCVRLCVTEGAVMVLWEVLCMVSGVGSGVLKYVFSVFVGPSLQVCRS